MPPSLFLVGVSGGADSLALALLLDRWCRIAGHKLRVLIVDHGLRPEAEGEAEQVRRRLRVRGIKSEILTWRGPKPASGVQAAARDARFGLMIDRAKALGAAGLFLAHHLQDQAETMIMRLGRDSGPDGLSGMRPRQIRAGVPVMRPLLGVSKARLRAHCLAEAQAWIEDPSNSDRRFERVRVRQETEPLAAVGLTAGRLQRLALAFGRLRIWSDEWLAAFLGEIGNLDQRGFAQLDLRAVADLPPPLRRKLLAGLLQSVGGQDYPPRSERLARLETWFDEGGGRRMTLSGCLVWKGADGAVSIARETPRHVRPHVIGAGAVQLWDGRFEVSWRGDEPAWLHMLTRSGDRRLRHLECSSDSEPMLPQSIRTSMPAVTDLDGRVFAPHFCESWNTGSSRESGLLKIEFCPAVPWVAEAFRASKDDRAATKV